MECYHFSQDMVFEHSPTCTAGTEESSTIYIGGKCHLFPRNAATCRKIMRKQTKYEKALYVNVGFSSCFYINKYVFSITGLNFV